jgi:phage shock protein E
MNNIIFKILVFVVSLSLFTGCTKVSDEEILAGRKAMQNGAMMIDVRSQKEFNKGHIEGAVNIPIAYVDKMFNSIPRDKELIVYCRSGSRSAVAARLLREQGWTVYDVATQEDWVREIKPKPAVKP